MENNIIIKKDLKFDYMDLMSNVDPSSIFTLEDIFAICENSKIPMDILCKILKCRHIPEIIEESKLIKEKDISDKEYSDIEYLELYFNGDRGEYDDKRLDMSSWGFHGVGIKGIVPEDVLKHCNLSDIEKSEYIEKYAIEFTPTYKLIKYNIKIKDSMFITDISKIDDNNSFKTIDFQPSISLITLLFSIFWELSFCGSPKDRDIRRNELNTQIEGLEKGEGKSLSLGEFLKLMKLDDLA